MKNVWPDWKNVHVRVGLGLFPPALVVQIKALACELPAIHGRPLSRWSIPDLVQEVCQSGLVARLSGSTLWRWLHEDAIRPWQHRSWIFPRDPNFALKAGRVLDLYHRLWDGKSLKDDEFVISADEKTSIQARARRHSTQPCQAGKPMRVEHEYQRCGAWVYLAALDVHQARIFGRCERKNGMVPFAALVDQVMTSWPYREARRVFWIVDNGSAHRGRRAVERLQSQHPRLVLVHLPIHASWLNQIEIYFSIVQRKVLTPNDFQNLDALSKRLLDFQPYWESIAQPFDWKFTRQNLNELLQKIHYFPNRTALPIAA